MRANESKEMVPQSQCLQVTQGSISTGKDFARFMSALMVDAVAGRISAGTCNAACNAGGKLLKIVEMQLKYGTPKEPKRIRDINLTDEPSAEES